MFSLTLPLSHHSSWHAGIEGSQVLFAEVLGPQLQQGILQLGQRGDVHILQLVFHVVPTIFSRIKAWGIAQQIHDFIVLLVQKSHCCFQRMAQGHILEEVVAAVAVHPVQQVILQELKIPHRIHCSILWDEADAACLYGCRVFSKLDLGKGYLQVPVAAGDIANTSIITPFGLFEFTRMPFGLHNAGMTFQRLMDSISGGLPFAFVYLDDILVASSNEATHKQHMEAVFTVLQQNGNVNLDQCLFACKSIDFLGHHLSATGIGPLPSRVQAFAEFPRPATVKQLQAFLGLLNFYWRFIPAAARLILPLTRALRGGPKGSALLSWTPAMAAAFQVARGALSSSAVLAHPVAGAELSLVTDASATHVGVVIQQRHGGQAWRPLGFFSAQLNKAEAIYSAFDRELLAVVAAIRHFRYMLEGQNVVVFTDHKPLVGALHRRSDPISAHQQHHLSFVTEFAPSICHITGESNVVADTLSCPSSEYLAPPSPGSAATDVVITCSGPVGADQGSNGVKVPSRSSVPPAIAGSSLSPSPVDMVVLAVAQAACPDCQRTSLSSALRVSEVSLQDSPILVDTSSSLWFLPPFAALSSTPCTAWRIQASGHQAVDFEPLCVARFGIPGGSLVPGLPTMPTGQSHFPTGCATGPHCQPRPAV
jgi:hypothetical protein